MGKLNAFLRQKSAAAANKVAEGMVKKAVRRIEKKASSPHEVRVKKTLLGIKLVFATVPYGQQQEAIIKRTRETIEREIREAIVRGEHPTLESKMEFYHDKEVKDAYDSALLTDSTAILETVIEEELAKAGLEG